MIEETQAPPGSAQEHDLDSFLGHSNRTGGASFLENWKNRTPPEIRIVLHTKGRPRSVWQNPWPKIVTRERDGKEVREVWSGTFNSWEHEDVLQRQYLREDDGSRQFPPQICPMAIMIEEVERLMRDGELNWRAQMFKFEGDDASKGKTLHAGSLTNKVKKIWEDATDKEKREARKAGFPGPSDAWKESMMAKCQYVLTVIDYDDPAAGIQIAKETTLVGDKLKKVIRDRMTSEGDDKGNPLVTPYVMQITHVPKAKQFQDRYDVVAIAQKKLTDTMLEMVQEKDAPSLDRYTQRGDIIALRASMEDHYCGPADLLDWDFIFGKAEEYAGIADDPDESAEDVAGSMVDGDEAQTTNVASHNQSGGVTAGEVNVSSEGKTEPEGDEEPEVDPDRYLIAKRKGKGENQLCFAKDGAELFACEDCEAIMRDDEDNCPKCGADYSDPEAAPELELTPEPEPTPKPKAKPKPKTKPKAAAKGGSKPSERAAEGGRDVGF